MVEFMLYHSCGELAQLQRLRLPVPVEVVDANVPPTRYQHQQFDKAQATFPCCLLFLADRRDNRIDEYLHARPVLAAGWHYGRKEQALAHKNLWCRQASALCFLERGE